MVNNRIPDCPVAVCFQNAACLTPTTMKEDSEKINRTIALDMHPDVFSAAAVLGSNAQLAKAVWVHDRQQTALLEKWALKYLNKSTDTVVLEASGNSFEVASRLRELGYHVEVLESQHASKLKHNYCNDDKQSAVKLARYYLSGLGKIVWQPDKQIRQLREVHFGYRNAVNDCTRQRNRIRSFLNESCVRLPPGTRLTQAQGLKKALSLHEWTSLQQALITDKFEQLWAAEKRRKFYEQIMITELLARPQWAQLWRLMGVRHVVAFGLLATIGDVRRFATAKKLVGYFGLSPRKAQSGNDAKGRELGLGKGGRRDVRALLVQSAQNALNQKNSPLHKWGWRLVLRRGKNKAVAAVARKLTVAIWHLLQGHGTALTELGEHLAVKLAKLATVLGKEALKEMGFTNRQEFITQTFKNIQLST